MPFNAVAYRRVFSGSADVQSSPLGAYIAESIPIKERDVLVVDKTGGGGGLGQRVVPQRPPRHQRAGVVAVDPRHGARRDQVRGQPTHFLSVPVPSTPLTVVGMAPTREIDLPLAGLTTWLPWVLLALAAALAAGILALLVRLVNARASLTRANAEHDEMSRLDRLTGLYNRRHLEAALERAALASRRTQLPVALLMVDVDHFKWVNDRHGHAAGDAVLREVADRLVAVVRGEDVVGRWGGEEFLVVLPHTSIGLARQQAERLRGAVAALPIAHASGEEPVTVSVGCAAAIPGPIEPLVAAADAALYEAKAAGRNRGGPAEPLHPLPRLHPPGAARAPAAPARTRRPGRRLPAVRHRHPG